MARLQYPGRGLPKNTDSSSRCERYSANGPILTRGPVGTLIALARPCCARIMSLKVNVDSYRPAEPGVFTQRYLQELLRHGDTHPQHWVIAGDHQPIPLPVTNLIRHEDDVMSLVTHS